MKNTMAVLLDGIAQLEYDRSKPLTDLLASSLDNMDKKMDGGINLGNQHVPNPDNNQRAQFVAANLAHAIQTNNESQAAALCSYMATRWPDLKQIKIDHRSGEVTIDLVFDEQYKKQVAVQLKPLH